MNFNMPSGECDNEADYSDDKTEAAELLYYDRSMSNLKRKYEEDLECVEAAKERREQLLEGGNPSLPKEEFNSLFCSSEDQGEMAHIRQETLMNANVAAAISALSHSPFF